MKYAFFLTVVVLSSCINYRLVKVRKYHSPVKVEVMMLSNDMTTTSTLTPDRFNLNYEMADTISKLFDKLVVDLGKEITTISEIDIRTRIIITTSRNKKDTVYYDRHGRIKIGEKVYWGNHQQMIGFRYVKPDYD